MRKMRHRGRTWVRVGLWLGLWLAVGLWSGGCKNKKKRHRRRGVSQGTMGKRYGVPSTPRRGGYRRRRRTQPPADGALAASSLRIVSWNIKKFSWKKKNAAKRRRRIEEIAKVLRDADIVAIQEATIKGGAKAVALLDDLLDRTGFAWDYVISEPTSNRPGKKGSERYAYLWKTSKVRLKKAWLEPVYARRLDREPYLARFVVGTQRRALLLLNFHALPKGKKPQKEIKILDDIARTHSRSRWVMMGDFNLSQKHKAFRELRAMGFVSGFQKQKTSLKRKTKGKQCLAYEYDNFFYRKRDIKVVGSGVIDLTRKCRRLAYAQALSDHLPIYLDIKLHR